MSAKSYLWCKQLPMKKDIESEIRIVFSYQPSWASDFACKSNNKIGGDYDRYGAAE